jgi:hypothetical protein
VFVGVARGEAVACSCAPPPDIPDEFRQSAAVLEGLVTDIDTPQIALGWLMSKHIASDWLGTSRPSAHDQAAAQRRITLKVLRVWKGDVGRQAVISTGYGGGDCGFPFVQGERYLVYADRFEGFLSTGICGRTAAITDAKSDLDYLASEELQSK